MQQAKNLRIFQIIFVVSLCLEIIFQIFGRKIFGIYLNPILWILAGFMICFTAFKLIGFRPSFDKVSTSSNIQWWQKILFVFAFVGLAYWCGNFMNKIFHKIPIDPATSDILPTIQTYIQRLLSGEVVYRPIPYEGYEVGATYLPLLWSPYLFSEWLNIDYRWTAYLIFLIPLFLYQYRLLNQSMSWGELGFKMLIPFLWLYLFTQFEAKMLGMSVELLPIGFYLLLTLSIFHRKTWVVALGILLCLMSRYAFTFWLPVYLLTYLIERGFFKTFKVGLIILVGVISIYIVPFLSKDWTIFTNGLKYYERTAVDQWKAQDWQASDEIPYHLQRGLSTAIYFYNFQAETKSSKERLDVNRKAHLFACAFAAFLLLLGYVVYRKRGLNPKIYFLIGLKFYLTFFYGFFYVPFSYLFQLPLFLSVAILYHIPFTKTRQLKESNTNSSLE